MSIEKKSTEVLGLCKKLAELRKNDIRASQYTRIENDLAKIVGIIEPISKTVIALAKEIKNNVANPVPKAPDHTANLLNAALKIVNDNDLELAAIDLNTIRDVFYELREKLRIRAENDWSAIKSKHVPWPEDLLSGLETIGGFRTQVSNLRRCAQTVAKTMTNLPQDKGDIENFLRVVEEYQVATEQIGLPSFMKIFLQHATRTHGVLLDSLTPEVRSWLEENQLLNKFAIRFA